MERILRGQQSLKGDLPLKFISMMTRYKGGKLESYISEAAADLSDFLSASKALPS